MRIGELSRRTGISTRMLRYYEEQGLLSAERASSGYREYVESDVQRASTIGSLINSGLTTKLVAIVLSMSDRPEEWKPTCNQTFADLLTHELTSIDDKIACLQRSRVAVRDYLGRVSVTG
jgi:DNA-binding transcriptional MerR regulator